MHIISSDTEPVSDKVTCYELDLNNAQQTNEKQSNQYNTLMLSNSKKLMHDREDI